MAKQFPENKLFSSQTGATGIELALSGNQDVIFIASELPDMDSLNLCRNLKQKEQVRDIPLVLVLTGSVSKEKRIQALEAGIETFLTLPTDEEEFAALVKTMVKVKVANQQEILLTVNNVQNQLKTRPEPGAELWDQEDLFRSIFEYHTSVKLIIDPDTGSIVDANRAAESFYGWPKERLKQMKIQDINTLSPEEIRQALACALTDSQNYFEFCHRLADGSLRNVGVFSSHIEIKGKTFLHSIIHDITKRKQVEALLKASEEELRLINELTTEMLDLQNVEDIYTYIVTNLQKRLPDTVILYNSINEENNSSRVEKVAGIESSMMNKILKTTGFSPHGKIYNLLPQHTHYFRCGKFVEFKGGLTEFSASELSSDITQIISKIIGLNKIYTIGIVKDKSLLASIHFFTFNGKAISDANFIETLVKQAGIVLQKKMAEQALKVSEEKYRRLAENMKDVVWTLDTATLRFIYISPSIKALSGYSAEELIGKSIEGSIFLKHYDTIISDIREQRASFLAGEITADDFSIREIEQPCKDGSIVRAEIISHLWFNPQTKNIEVHGVTRDITARKKAEEALKESEKRLRRAELTSKSGNWELHFDSLMMIISEGAQKIYGIEGVTFDYEFIKTIPLSEYRKVLDELLFNLINYEQAYDIEFKIRTADTKEIKDIHSVALYDRERKVLFGVIQDITERKRAEEALKASEAKFRTLFTRMTEGFALHELIYNSEHKAVNYKILAVNPAFEEQIGLVSEKAIGALGTELYGTREAPYLDVYAQVAETGGHHFFQTYFSPLGKYFEISAYSPNPGFFATIFTDITDRKLGEKALKESEARFRELNATKDKFFSIIAHDLKGPFNSIIGLSDLLEEQIQEKNYSGIEEYAKIIHKSSFQAIELLTNLLEWSRSQTGRIEYLPEYVEMVTLINEVIDLFHELAQQKSITVIKNIPRNVIAFADKAMISTVLRNFISNAIKFTHPGGQINISAEITSEELIILISDNGIGINRELLDKLFKIEETHSTPGTRKEKGTGLGLLLCKEFVDKHGGRIWVESTVKQGSKFYFSIPTKR